jgi:inosine-uridine nucleoside N-ribohydrolase
MATSGTEDEVEFDFVTKAPNSSVFRPPPRRYATFDATRDAEQVELPAGDSPASLDNNSSPNTGETGVYKHGARVCPYRSEKLEISAEEALFLQRLVSRGAGEAQGEAQGEAGANASASQFRLPGCLLPARDTGARAPRKLIIDTDVGTDADDILTLLAVLHLPPEDCELLAVTTNYFPTRVRKRVADDILAEYNRQHPGKEIPVVAGTGYLCGSHRPVFLHGNEGCGLVPKLEGEEQIRRMWTPVPDDDWEAPDKILELLRANPGEITIVSIGIPTNLARCVVRAEEAGETFASLVGHVVCMGGGSILTSRSLRQDCIKGEPPFDVPADRDEAVEWMKSGSPKPVHFFPNHNVSGDTLASCVLFDSGARISVIAHDVTLQVVGRLLFEWLSRRHGQRGQCPHDPLTLYEAVYPTEPADGSTIEQEKPRTVRSPGLGSCLEYATGTFVVHEWAAFMTFVPGDGPHRVAVSVRDDDSFLEWLTDALVGCVPEDLKTDSSQVATKPEWD